MKVLFRLLFYWKFIYLLCTLNSGNMELVKTITELQQKLAGSAGKGAVGFVPTMGALHEGHLSLVKQAANETGIVVVSIFVNPTQFNDKNDFSRYPRDIESDMEILEGTGCNFVFAPDEKEIYPQPDTRKFNFGNLETVMEGIHRPGHFNGVAQVVSRLFEIVQPDKAYFGLKDFQQLAIIKAMARQLNLKTEIVACPIIREPDGLAKSSRNMLLSGEERENAVTISKTLFEVANNKGEKSVQEIKNIVTNSINKNPFLRVEYFEIVDDQTLQPISDWGGQGGKIGCIAVFCGKIRLIDNIVFN